MKNLRTGLDREKGDEDSEETVEGPKKQKGETKEEKDELKKKDDEPKPPTLTDGPEKSRKDARAREGADADPTPDAEDPAPEVGAEGG